MNVALGFKAHSGWAALVVLGATGNGFQVVERRRVELVDAIWAKAPYHAAEEMTPKKAAALVKRATGMAQHVAVREMERAVGRARDAGHEIAACAVLMPSPMPAWTVEEIRAVHFRMHQAEGALFPEALVQAARTCGLEVVSVPEKRLSDYADKASAEIVGSLGKSVGPPWGKDQKTAALAAMIALGKRR